MQGLDENSVAKNASDDYEWDEESDVVTMGSEKCNILTAYAS